jgi:hypothetical protein
MLDFSNGSRWFGVGSIMKKRVLSSIGSKLTQDERKRQRMELRKGRIRLIDLVEGSI